MVATLKEEELQYAEAVRSCVVSSVKVPVAVNCWVVPSAIEELPGETAIDSKAAAVTVSVVVPLIEPEVALRVEVPAAKLAASPCALIVATPVEDDVHRTVGLTSWALPSVKVPVAVNCCVVPSGMDGIAGVTTIETKAAGVTVNAVVPETEPEAAVIVVVPVVVLVASPWLAEALLIVTTLEAEEAQVTDVVRF
jgi:hypothetical protein